MKRKLFRQLVAIAGILMVGRAGLFAQPPGSSVITYQGRLQSTNGIIDEPCEFIFSLYDAPIGGNLLGQAGTALTPVTTAVAKGLFTVPLDFGAAAFDGNDRWIEIQVRRASAGGTFTTLAPRQQLTATPKALHAVTGGNYVGSLQEAYDKGGPGAGRTINTNAGPLSLQGTGGLQVAGVIETSGGIRFPDGSIQTSAITSGAAPVLGPVFWDDNGSDLFPSPLNAFVGIGTDTPNFPLDVDGDARVLGTLITDFIDAQSPLQLQTGGVTRVFIDDAPGFVGIGTGTDTPIGLLHLGSDDSLSLILDMDRDGAGNDGAGIIAFGTTAGGGFGTQYGEIQVDPSAFGGSPPLELNPLSMNDVLIANGGGNVGIGTQMPAEKLHVVGNIQTDGFIMPTGAANGLVLTSDAVGAASWTMPNANPTGPAGGDLTGMYPNPDIAMNAVGTNEIADGQVMTADIADMSVTTGKLADNAVTSPKIMDGEVMTADIADNAVTGMKIADGTIMTADLANNSVDNTKLASDAMSLNKVTGGVAQSVGGNIDIPAPGKLLVNFISSHSPLELQTGGVTRVYIDDPSGDVGIGTGVAAPFGRLHVLSPGFLNTHLESANIDGTWLSLQNTSAGGTNWQLLSTGSNNGGGPGNLLIGHGPAPNSVVFANIFANGTTNHVGIGTTAPLTRLHVVNQPLGLTGAGIFDEDLIVEASDARLGLYSAQAGIGGSSITLGEILGGALVNNWGIVRETTPGGAGLRFTFGPSPDIGANPSRVYFDDSGNVGIGTITPATTIEAFDTQAVERLITQNHTNGAVLELFNLTPNPNFLGAINFYDAAINTVGQIGYLGSNIMTFRVNGAERARIDANGNLGIMTTTPTEKLHVVGNGLFTGTVFTTMVDSNTDGADMNQPLALKTEGIPHIIIQADGKVGIGSPPPMPVDPDPMIDLEVTRCIKAECFKTPNDSTVEVSALKMVKGAGGPFDLLAGINGVMTAHPTALGLGFALVPLDFPTKILGTDKKLKNVRVCYKVGSTASYITASHLRMTNDDGTFVNIATPAEQTDQTSRTFTCYDLTPAAPVMVTGPVFLALDLTYGGTATAHDIAISKITVTLSD